MKRGKKAQFYIIAAVIIAVLIVGLSTTINYAITSQTPTRFYDLSNQYDLETAKIIDYGAYQTYTPPVPIDEAIRNFTRQFYENAAQKDPNIEVLAVYNKPNSNQIEVFSVTENETKFYDQAGTALESSQGSISTSNINLQGTGTNLGTDVKQRSLAQKIIPYLTSTTHVMIKTSENTIYNMTISSDQPTFYFIIQTKKESGEVNVATTK